MKKMDPKHPKDSATVMTEIVLPNDTNALHNLRGGKILHWMDIASAIAAGRHANRIVVTASVDQVSFLNPIKVGDVVTICAKVTRVFNTSIEVYVDVSAENLPTQTNYKCNDAYYTFVALDSNGKPTKVAPLIPESDEEKKQHESAMRRRELRLVLAGKMKPSDAPELSEIFKKD